MVQKVQNGAIALLAPFSRAQVQGAESAKCLHRHCTLHHGTRLMNYLICFIWSAEFDFVRA